MNTPSQKHNFWKIVHPLSLALNILMASYIGGQWAASSPSGAFKLDPRQRIDMFADLLPQAEARLLREAYENRGGAFAAAHSNHEEAVKRVLSLMAQPQLDVPALRAAMAKARGYNERLNDLLSETLLDTIQKMPASSRAELLRESWR